MIYFVLCLAVGLMIAIWPLNRWAVKHNGRTQSIGLMISLTATILALVGALISGESLFSSASLLFGAIMGIAYSVGFCMIIFYCLKIGPAGPTVMLNNLGLLFPVLLSIFLFSNGTSPTLLTISGIILTILSLVLMSFNKSSDDNVSLSSKWFKWIILGWLLSGISMSSQFLATHYAPENPYSFAFSAFGVSFLVLAGISLAKKDTRPNRVEVIVGVSTGFVNVISTPILFYLLKNIPAYVIYPVIMASPILVMLLAGHFVYKENLNRFGWLACIFGIIGLIFFNIN